jgi:hypothetical protein
MVVYIHNSDQPSSSSPRSLSVDDVSTEETIFDKASELCDVLDVQPNLLDTTRLGTLDDRGGRVKRRSCANQAGEFQRQSHLEGSVSSSTDILQDKSGLT